jgi:hypothetical protein
MKQTKNNEMDLLLRGWARREGAGAAGSEDNLPNHLDADELNSYAEHTLPAAARARYTSHLADCDKCRKIVLELTSASGVKASEGSVPQQTSTSLRQKLLELFSQDRLRYAVPVLALLVFVAIGLVIFRQQTQPDQVASSQPVTFSVEDPTKTKPADTVAEAQKSPANGFLNDSQTNTTKDKDKFAKSDSGDESSIKTRESAAIAANSGASAGKTAEQVNEPTFAPEPAAAPPPKPQTTTESRADVTREKKEADKNEEPARRQEGERARTYDKQNQVGPPEAGSAAAIQSDDKRRATQPKSVGGAGEKALDRESEIRTVLGKHFRYQGSVWIDTNYKSSSPTTILTRGSEQFRALVADEPEIRAFAARLPGEVVVVWKGRAYRIR